MISKQLQKEINERMTKQVGQAIIDASDLIMRLRLGQLSTVCEILTKYCSLYQEGRGVTLEEPLYKAVELGEYIKCANEHPECEEAGKCWITRKGFCEIIRKSIHEGAGRKK